MQPTYVYPSEVDPEAQWRSKFSMLIPIVIGFLQFILTLAIIGLEIGSVFISPIKGTLYAGFWCSAIFILSWISMSILVCCHRSRRYALIVFGVSILCALSAVTLIVLDALFIADVDRCFFSSSVCQDLRSSFPRQVRHPLGRKVQLLKAQLSLACALLATSILYMLLFIVASLGSRSKKARVVVENGETSRQTVHASGRRTPQSWKAASVPVTYEPSQLECPHCGTLIKLAPKKR